MSLILGWLLARAGPVPIPQAPPAPAAAPTAGPCRHATKGDIVRRVVPTYPSAAEDRGTRGVVEVRTEIGPDGAVIAASVVSPLGGVMKSLEQASVDAARRMLFAPQSAHSGRATRVLCVTFAFAATERGGYDTEKPHRPD